MKKKILSLTSDRGLGGISASLISYSQAMALEGIKHIVCAPRNSPSYAELTSMANVEMVPTPPRVFRWHTWTNYRFSRLLRRQMAEADLILIHNAKHASVPSEFRHKTFVINHNGKLRLLDKAPNIIFLNKTIQKNFYRSNPDLTTCSHVIGHGFKTFPEINRQSDEKAPIKIICAGRLIEKKGYRDLLETAHLMQQIRVNCHFSIYGEGSDEAYLRQRMAALGLDNVTIHPWTHDLRSAMAEADIFCTPSHGESFALVIGEAMEAGLAISSTRTDGAMEFFSSTTKDAPIGLLSDPRDYQRMADNLTELVEATNLRKTMQKNARKVILNNFTMETLGQKLRDLCIEAQDRPRIFIATQTFPPRIGGMENVMHALAKKLSFRGHYVTVLPNKTFKKPASFKTINLRLVKPFRILAKRLYFKCVLRADDIVICDSWKSFNVIPKNFDGRIIILAHGQEYLKTGKRAETIQAALSNCHQVIASSRFTADLIQKNFTLTDDKISVIPPTYMLEPSEIKAEHKDVASMKSKNRLISVCRLEKRKGLMQVLHALHEADLNEPDWRWDIIGNGPEAYFLQKEITALGLDDKVFLHHNMNNEEKNHHLREADLFVMPSYREKNSIEGFGISYIEAASFGLPSIAGREGGSPEAVKNGETGWCVDPETGGGLTAALEEALNSPEERKRRGVAAFDLFNDKMSAERTFAIFVEKAVSRH